MGKHILHHMMKSLETATILLNLRGLEMLENAWTALVFCLYAWINGFIYLNLQQI
jgi:hypothetical protein